MTQETQAQLAAFWQFVSPCAWEDKLATQQQEEAMLNRVIKRLQECTRAVQIALLEGFEQAVEAMVQRLHETGINGDSLRSEVEYIVGLGEKDYNVVMQDTALVMGYHRSQDHAFKDAFFTVLCPQEDTETDETYFWSFVERLKAAERQMQDWEEEAIAFLQSYPTNEQQSFKKSFFCLRDDLIKRVQRASQLHVELDFDPSHLHQLAAFTLFQGRNFYYQTWFKPTGLTAFQYMAIGNRGDLFASVTVPTTPFTAPEPTPERQVPLSFLAPVFVLSLARAFKEGQDPDDLAKQHDVDRSVIDALLRLAWTLGES